MVFLTNDNYQNVILNRLEISCYVYKQKDDTELLTVGRLFKLRLSKRININGWEAQCPIPFGE